MKSLKISALVALMAAPVAAETVLNAEKSRLYEADYEAVLAENGIAMGAAVYGQSDADYDVYLTDANLFPPLLGHSDADYEAVLNHDAFSAIEVASY